MDTEDNPQVVPQQGPEVWGKQDDNKPPELPTSPTADCFHLTQQVGLDFSDGLPSTDSVYIHVLGGRGSRVRIPGVRESLREGGFLPRNDFQGEETEK